ncbi:MAG: ATP synthase F1 subunit epsilon [Candidatus Riflebacteria bacterium]|nr:ATP synthase F1 subunit epsilon [Candidatus Riflebacteria bacterium]MBR4569813.1 ATP synthase F1 subunit epsilon [Candidatus Riflebacteria bacterium]
MSRTLKISIIRPGRPPYNTEGTAMTIPSYDGYLGILYDRQPLLSLMKAGLITITNVNGKKTFFAVSGGFAEVEDNVVTLLCDSVVTSNDISENNSTETTDDKDAAPKLFLKDASLMNESEKFKYLVEMLQSRLRQEEQKTETKA